ncbi:inositol monophosphatase family protein [Nocardiopsis sp. CNT312]|uniref:inositol monophosphatase family protein n=1 Tax=Nocardiopsis sp. CNT312 TaxID=1137268 RepID=UPI00048EF0AC|nr:inositol monophosphatase family protein [Nocardiopsis sp. CNT312]
MFEVDAVTEILREAAEAAILPRFRSLAEDEVSEKGPGDLVTVADREAEELIGARLRGVVAAPVVGEEAVSADPGLLRALNEEETAWLVDPVDGTRNFVNGDTRFGVMAALVHRGETVASWILRPTEERVYIAERGSGTWRDGVRIRRGPAPAAPARMRGLVLTTALPAGARRRAEEAFASVGPGAHCSAVDYPHLFEGELDFIVFGQTCPWDHAPGTLMLAEAGGTSLRPDGDGYRPGDATVGLLNAADGECWKTARSLLFG